MPYQGTASAVPEGFPKTISFLLGTLPTRPAMGRCDGSTPSGLADMGFAIAGGDTGATAGPQVEPRVCGAIHGVALRATGVAAILVVRSHAGKRHELRAATVVVAEPTAAGWRRPLPLTVCDLAEREVSGLSYWIVGLANRLGCDGQRFPGLLPLTISAGPSSHIKCLLIISLATSSGTCRLSVIPGTRIATLVLLEVEIIATR